MLQRPILQGQINFPLCLAPMVGLSHIALREVIRSYMPEGARTIWPTEMLNSRRLPNEIVGKTPETLRGDFEDGLVPQILGNQENFIAQSLARLETWGASAIDINMGCPVEKALRHNYGVSLMGDPQYAADVVAMTVRNTALPVSVKLRAAGPDVENGKALNLRFLIEFVQGLESAGASWVCLHPRTAAQKRRGQADWGLIQKLRSEVRLPVIGNGDIQTSKDVVRMLNETSCDMVMAGRALAARPWMVWQFAEDIGLNSRPLGQEGHPPRTSLEEGAEYGKVLDKLLVLNKNYFGEDLGLRKIRFWIRTTSVWLEFGHTLVSLSTKAKTISELQIFAQEFFSTPQSMLSYTDLRQ